MPPKKRFLLSNWREKQKRRKENEDKEESEEERLQGLARMAKQAAEQRNEETEEARRYRLENMARHASFVRKNETEEARKNRLENMARHASSVRENEAEEEKQARLQENRVRRQHNQRRSTMYLAALKNLTDELVPVYSVGEMIFSCNNCNALNFRKEKVGSEFMICCHKGKVLLPSLSVPRVLEQLIAKNDKETRSYLENIRSFNSAFAFASLGAQIEPPPGHGPYVFRIHGQMYHYVGGLHPQDGASAAYASLYIMDSRQALEQRSSFPKNADCSQQMMKRIQTLLEEVNPHVRLWRHAYEIEQDALKKAREDGQPVASVRMFIRHNTERRYNDPTAHKEIAAVFVAPDGEPPGSRDIVIHSRSNILTKLSVLSPYCDPFTYPLLFPYGELGFELNMQHASGAATTKRNRVTLLQFYCFRVAVRPGFSLLHSSGKLFQQYVVDAYVKWEGNNLQWIKENQSTLRVEQYQGLMDHVARIGEEGLRAGKIVILPSSFIGSPRNMQQNFQDAMAIVGKFGKPDLFITFTCNPKWPEIVENLKPWERVEHRPDLVSRVFAMKLDELMDDLTKKHVFGVVKAFLYVIEFQKRGLPHAHILIILTDDDKIRETEDIDRAVCAEIPDESVNPRLYNIVKSCMVHGPCGSLNPTSPCMEDNKCTKQYPKDFAEETKQNVNGYPVYRRRDNGSVITVRGIEIDNTWIVPYNPYLSIKYDAHINVEICSSIKSVKYLFKYVYKGYDCASVQIQQQVPNQEGGVISWDEINTYLDARYVSATESVWRLHENRMHKQSHTIKRLAVHLPFEQMVFFTEGEEEQALERAASSDTTLTAWFKLNAQDVNARDKAYRDVPVHYVWIDKDKKWKARQRGGDSIIGRLYSVSPKDCERYFLRMLLLHVTGATSFEDVRKVNGIVYDTFREAATQRGLLTNDEEWKECFQEASLIATPNQLLQMFAYICVFCTPSSPAVLFNLFKDSFCEDYFRRTGDEHSSVNMALNDIRETVVLNGLDYTKLGLPMPEDIPSSDKAIDVEEERRLGEELSAQLNEDQGTIVNEVLLHVRESRGGSFFIDGPGGTGKTFIYQCLIHTLRGERMQVLPVAFTGIAANLLAGGKTAHSAFKLPIPLVENSVSNMSANSKEAEKLRNVNLIIWDEASMAPAIAVDVVDRLLKDVCENDDLFGGKVMLFGGDFRQILPVVRHGNRTTIIEACMKRSRIWPLLTTRALTSNMRTGPAEEAFSDFLLQLGNGSIQTESDISATTIRLPDECILRGDLIDQVFGSRITMQDISRITECAVLCPRNVDCDFINEEVMKTKLQGEIRVYCSADSIVSENEEEIQNYPVEFLNSLTPSGMPPHKLKLKVGAVCMLLRNVNVKNGLVNGTRVVVKRLHNKSIDIEVLTGQAKGTRVFLSRIDLTTSDPTMPFVIKRRQFPVKLAFAMTINKAQGQTFQKIGLHLPEPVFSHGQLYVAFSRVRRLADIKVQVDKKKNQGRYPKKPGVYTSNIVYEEVLR